MSATTQPLTSLQIGGSGTISEIKLPPEHRSRILEMGLVIGTPLQLVRFAPLGDPVEIKVRGYYLTLRRADAELILVQVK
jgi:ferrous iron transport protein A